MPPVDMTPSTGLLSAASIASENSLPNAPKSADSDREHAGEGAEPDDIDPDQRPDQRVDAADRVEEAARPESAKTLGGRRSCAASKPTGNASSGREQRAEERDRERLGERDAGTGRQPRSRDRAAASASRYCRAGCSPASEPRRARSPSRPAEHEERERADQHRRRATSRADAGRLGTRPDTRLQARQIGEGRVLGEAWSSCAPPGRSARAAAAR